MAVLHNWFRTLGATGPFIGLLSARLIAFAAAPQELPSGSFWIEAEDFDYNGGRSITNASKMPYAGGAYDGLGAVAGTDYSIALTFFDEDNYRFGEAPNVVIRYNGQASRRTHGFDVKTNFFIADKSGPGWFTGWFNYTRSVPPGFYKAYAALSHEEAARSRLRGNLSLVVEGAGTPNQVLEEVGAFDARGTGAWGENALVKMTAADGAEAAIHARSTNTTLRFTLESGAFDFLALVPTSDPEIHANPSPGFLVPNNLRLDFDVICYEIPADLASCRLWLDGTEVTAQSAITGSSTRFNVHHRPATLLPTGPHNYKFEFSLIQTPPRAITLEGAFSVYAAQIQPDLLVRREIDWHYAGDRIYRSDGADQTKTSEVSAGERAVYFVQLRNRGSGLAEFALSGTGGGGGWTVTYFHGTTNITEQVVGSGYLLPPMLRFDEYEFRIEVSPNSAVLERGFKEVLLTATSVDDATKLDSVKAVSLLSASSPTPQGGTYTARDFAKGAFLGVVTTKAGTQLELESRPTTYPYLWVPNSNESSVSKVDTRDGRELARYRTSPRREANPSRTTVDLFGNCWVANRVTGTVVKLGLMENGGYIDRNHNGIIETSRDLNGDGDITDEEMLPWGADECVLVEVALLPGAEGAFVPGSTFVPYAADYWNPGPRGLAVDARNNIWIGTYGTMKFYYLDGETGRILRVKDFSALGHPSYGAVMDLQGVIWSSSLNGNHVLRFDPAGDLAQTIDLGHTAYGLGLAPDRYLFVAGFTSAALSRINRSTLLKEWTRDWPDGGSDASRGVVTTADGDVWVANSSSCTVGRWSIDGVLKTNIFVGPFPTGVAVDGIGKVWAVKNGDEYVVRIDPETNGIDFRKALLGARHYGYSDMTGFVSRNLTTRAGLWSVIHDARMNNAPWGVVSWTSSEPPGTAVAVRVRSSNDRLHWSSWESAWNGLRLISTPPGKYLQVQTSLQSRSLTASAELLDLTVIPVTNFNYLRLHYFADFQGAVGAEWSTGRTETSPLAPERRFLGRFGNTNVTLMLTNLPPHSAVFAACDLFVVGSWDGNSNNEGPDRWTWGVVGGRRLLDTTFDNGPTNRANGGQAYPGAFPDVTYPALTGAFETNTLGFAAPGQGPMDAVYHLTVPLPHTGDSLRLEFTAVGLDPNLPEASWALDNVAVYLLPPASSPRLIPTGFAVDGRFRFQLIGATSQTYEIQASTNGMDWAAIAREVLSTNRVEVQDTNAVRHATRLYRAVLEE